MFALLKSGSGAYGTLVTAINRFKDYFCDIFLDEITNRTLSRWVEYERQRGIKDITIRLWCPGPPNLSVHRPDNNILNR